jgi:hypothetical protein
MTLVNFDPPCEIRDELYEAVLQCAVDECLPWALLGRP